MKNSIFAGVALTLALLSPSAAFAQTVIGPPVHFRASDIVVAAPSSEVLHLSMDVYVEVPNGPIDASVFGMLFNVEPTGAPIALVGASEPSASRQPIFPLDQSFVEFVAPAASGHDGAAIGVYNLPGANVTLASGEYGLFTLEIDVAPNTVGTYDLVFDTNPEFTGLAGTIDDDIVIYPNAEGNLVALATISIVPEPSSWALSAVAASCVVAWRFRRRAASRGQRLVPIQ